MIQFSLFNIPVRVQPWFWLTMAFLGGVIDTNTKAELIALLLFMLAGFVSILVHELGHALTAKHYGKYVEIVLHAFGGYAAYSGGRRLTRTEEFMITAAGPAIQILLGAAAFAVVMQVDGINENGKQFLGGPESSSDTAHGWRSAIGNHARPAAHSIDSANFAFSRGSCSGSGACL